MPWRLLTRSGHDVRFATEHGAAPAADQRLLDGVIFGQLGASAEPKDFYAAMLLDSASARRSRGRTSRPRSSTA